MKKITDKEFWEIISLLEWDGDSDACAVKLKDLIKDGIVKHPQSFYEYFMRIEDKINTETDRRIKADQESFAQGVPHGSDDCHFMDLPSELIGRGKKEVDKYLKGKYLVPYMARECFSYMFHDLEEDKIISRDRTPNSKDFILED